MVADPGAGKWVLTISHGCAGQTPPAADLTVTKDATPSFTRTFGWTIDKSANTDTVYSAGGGESGKATYTIAVTKDNGTDSGWAVSGTIDVFNPNDFDVNGVSISDSTSGGDCTVDDASLDVKAQSTASTGYTCTFLSNPASGTNTATADWGDIDSPNTSGTGTADYTFGDPTNLVNDNIDVTDTNGGSWNLTDSGSVSYDQTFTDPAGTCTPHTNTATITQTGQSASATVTDCQGADLKVTKDATPSFTRTYGWTIGKSVDKTKVTVDPWASATFNYTVAVTHDAGTDSGWQVTGGITVHNPNDWEDIDADLSDAIDNGGNCTVSSSTVTVPAGGDASATYTCTYDSAPSPAAFTNTATAAWDAAAASTPNDSASGSATGAFGDPTNLVDECVSVSDSYAASLGTACVGDANPTTFTYSRTISAPSAGTCQDYSNKATFTTNDTGATGSASRTVTVCSFKAPLTIGYWGTHLAKTGTSGCSSLPSGTGCSNNGPWTKDYLGKTICDGCTVGKLSDKYTAVTFQDAAKVVAANNCSNASSSDTNAAACLAAQLLAAQLNVANGANTCICDTIKKAKAAMTAVGYAGPGSKITLTGSGYTRQNLIDLKTALDNYNNSKGCPA
jgi:hypothetical protein